MQKPLLRSYLYILLFLLCVIGLGLVSWEWCVIICGDLDASPDRQFGTKIRDVQLYKW